MRAEGIVLHIELNLTCLKDGIIYNTKVHAVLDTSVLVSGLRSRQGASFQILKAIRMGRIRIAISVALALEYEAVLLRSNTVPGLESDSASNVIDTLCLIAHHQDVFYTWRPYLPDPDDDLILELAVAAGTGYIITHNVGDFKGSDKMGIQIVSPAEALNMI